MAVLVGSAPPFRPVYIVPNPNPIPIHDIAQGTLLAVGFPRIDRYEVALVPVCFLTLLTVFKPRNLKPVIIAVLERCFIFLLPVFVPKCRKPVVKAALVL